MRPLTPKQREALAEVCRTNGGGVRLNCTVTDDGTVVPIDRVYRALFKRELIQGKAGAYSTVVHTREGLALHRELLAAEQVPA
jgi:hypothetical protein